MYLGAGDGTLELQQTYPDALGTDSVVAGDFTGDGNIDLALHQLSTPAWCRSSPATATARSNLPGSSGRRSPHTGSSPAISPDSTVLDLAVTDVRATPSPFC